MPRIDIQWEEISCDRYDCHITTGPIVKQSRLPNGWGYTKEEYVEKGHYGYMHQDLLCPECLKKYNDA